MLGVLVVGFRDKEAMLIKGFMTICLPVGGVTALICASRAFFRGYGFLLCAFWGAFGFLTSLAPYWILKYIDVSMPSLFTVTVVLITLLYMVVCHFSENRSDNVYDKELINEVVDDDVKSLLLEPLYYTFKTKSYKFKGSKFGMLEDVENQFSAVANESVIHYVMWTLMIALLLGELIAYNYLI